MQINSRVTKWGNSLGLRINQEIAENLSLNAGSEISLSLDKKKRVLTIKALKQSPAWPLTESELIEGLTPENAHSELLTNPLDSEI
ncbi:MAG: hypothetical protein V3V09_06390 [Arenicellales bacterium]